MTVYERLQNGQSVDVQTDREYLEECIPEMHRSQRLCHQINQLPPYDEQIRPLLDELFEGRLPANASICTPLDIDRGKTVFIGENVFINRNFSVTSTGGITIGEGVMIAANVQIATANHQFDCLSVMCCKPVVIEKNAWIGMGAMIMPGVTVGEGAVVAGGAVVTHDVEPYTVVGGNPARFIKHTKQGLSQQEEKRI